MNKHTAALLEQHFDTAFAAPDGIKKLRELILTLAMQGKLVPQDPNDPPVSELLKDIETEKKRLVKDGKIKVPKPLPPVMVEEMPYALPQGWKWVRFGEIAQHNSGKTLDKGRNTGLPRDYITTSNLYWGRFELASVRQMLIREEELEKCSAKKNDLLICEGGEAGRAAVWDYESEVCFQNHVHRARFYGNVDPYLAYRFFEKLNATGEINQHRKGVGISNMSSAVLASIIFPLPPLSEQHRIVAKIDQLMARCDALKNLRNEREKKRLATHAAALSQLLDTTGNGSADDAWVFITQHFGDLYAVKENVTELRKAILQLAIAGRLTESMDSSPARKSISKSSDKPFTIPVHWNWVPLQAISDQSRGITYGIVKMGGEPSHGGVFALRCSDVKYRELDLSSVRRVSSEISDQYSRTVLKGGELLLNIRGTLGGCVVVPESIAGYNIAREIALIPLNDKAHADYILNVISSPYFTEATNSNLRGIAYKGLNLGTLSSFLVPLPPKDEQMLIVEKVNHLLALCNVLESRIDSASGKQAELLRAVMAQV